jgi:excisionase family DNA binding protein
MDETETKLWDVDQVSEALNCSTRHVYRLAEAGKMPAPVKLGALVRWEQRPQLRHGLRMAASRSAACRASRMAGAVQAHSLTFFFP